MYYEITSITARQDNKGNDKKVTEKFIVENAELFAEAEQKGLELYNGENDIVAIKQSKLMEFVNKREKEEQNIFFATIEQTMVDDDDNEKTMKYVVGLFAETIGEATKLAIEYMKQGLDDLRLILIKETKFIDII